MAATAFHALYRGALITQTNACSLLVMTNSTPNVPDGINPSAPLISDCGVDRDDLEMPECQRPARIGVADSRQLCQHETSCYADQILKVSSQLNTAAYANGDSANPSGNEVPKQCQSPGSASRSGRTTSVFTSSIVPVCLKSAGDCHAI